MFQTANETIKGIIADIERAVENELMSQLNEFISRGLIVVERLQPILVSDMYLMPNDGAYKVQIKTAVRLVLKDQEYIEKLEAENAALKSRLHLISTAIEGVK